MQINGIDIHCLAAYTACFCVRRRAFCVMVCKGFGINRCFLMFRKHVIYLVGDF